jgi:glyoxylate reductase
LEEPADNGRISSAHKEWAEIASMAEVIEPKARSREEFIAESKSGAFDGVLVAYRTFMSVAITGMVDEELISILPKSLKYIAHNGME